MLNQTHYARAERNEDEQSHEATWKRQIFTDETPGQEYVLGDSQRCRAKKTYDSASSAPERLDSAAMPA